MTHSIPEADEHVWQNAEDMGICCNFLDITSDGFPILPQIFC
jgi:hypothetical protein